MWWEGVAGCESLSKQAILELKPQVKTCCSNREKKEENPGSAPRRAPHMRQRKAAGPHRRDAATTEGTVW